MELTKVYDDILSGRALLLTGSGINVEVYNHQNSKLPTGKDLAKDLYRQCGINEPDDPFDLQDASQTFIEKKDATELITYLKNVFNIANLGESIRILYNLPWIRCYTTNYDEGPVLAARRHPVTLGKSTRTYLDKDNTCIYINGYIGNLSENTLLSEFKLTSKSYISTDNILSCSWGEALRNDLDIAETIVIVGLSLEYDLDLKRIVGTQNVNEKIIFIESEDISTDKIRKLNRLGTVENIGVQRFVKQLKQYQNESYIQRDETERIICFEKYAISNPKQNATSRDIYNLFMTGEVIQELFWLDNGKYKNFIYRNAINEMIRAIYNGKKLIFLHANLGNGKSFMLEILKRKLANKGVDVFTFIADANKQEIKDIKTIAKIKAKNVVIVENYFNHMELLKNFGLYINMNTIFILTARTMIYDTKLYETCKIFDVSAEDIVALDVNRLTDSERKMCFSIFEDNQLWGGYAKFSENEKRNLLQKKKHGNCELQAILIDIIHSSSMKNEIAKEVKIIRDKAKDYFPGMVIMLMSKVMALDINVYDVNRILKVQCMNNPIYTNNDAVKELVEFTKEGNQEYRIKSAVVAKEILSSLCTNEEIIDALTRIALYANQYVEYEKYVSILQNIVSFSHVNSFLSEKRDNISFIINYYDAIKSLQYYKDNSFFWLQYSIACLKYKEYDLAQNYVEVSYAKFVDSKYSVPFQCDNHQARILLVKIADGRSINLESDFISAHQLAMKPCCSDKDREENVIRLFYLYVEPKLSMRMKKGKLMRLYKDCCGDAYNRVQDFLHNMRNERDRRRYEALAQKLLKASTME